MSRPGRGRVGKYVKVSLMNNRIYKKIAVSVTPEAAEAVSDHLSTSTGGVIIDESSERILITAYADIENADGILAGLEKYMASLSEMGLINREGYLSSEEVPEEDWMAVFRSQHTLVTVSERLTVRPSWCPPSGGREIVVDPGLAFGTGTHATTRLCLVLLDLELARKTCDRMLDLGTGTGILAIAGAFLGARKVLAVDISPTAVSVAEQNVLDNNVTEIVEVREGTIRSVANKYDLVTANLTGGLLIYISRDLANSLADGGTLIVSGIMDDDRDGVIEALAESGLSLSDELSEGEWVALTLKK